jgi:hypothetical protein
MFIFFNIFDFLLITRGLFLPYLAEGDLNVGSPSLLPGCQKSPQRFGGSVGGYLRIKTRLLNTRSWQCRKSAELGESIK